MGPVEVLCDRDGVLASPPGVNRQTPVKTAGGPDVMAAFCVNKFPPMTAALSRPTCHTSAKIISPNFP